MSLLKPDNAEESFKCKQCGHVFARGSSNEEKCPLCGFTCTADSCKSIGASNEGY